MNSHQSTTLLQKHTKNDYETRFKLQSKNRPPNRKRRIPKSSNKSRMKSQALRMLGGEEVLDCLSIYFAQRVVYDDVLSEVYSDLNIKALVQILRDLLLLALDDNLSESTTSNNLKNDYNREILRPHVLRGLMEREDDFDRLHNHFADALIACQMIKETKVMIETQRRFGLIRPLLEVMYQEHLQSKKDESTPLPVLGKVSKKKKKKKKQEKKSTSAKSWWQLE